MKFIPCIVPIQRQIDPRRFDHFGTCVFLKVEGRHMLIGFKFDEAKELLVGTKIEEVFSLIQQQSIDRWLAKRTKPVHKMFFDLQTGSLESESESGNDSTRP